MLSILRNPRIAATLVLCGLSIHNCSADETAYTAVRYSRTQIYHSPQKPGWTSWVGAWLMPNGDLMVGVTQATGPLLPEHTKRTYKGLNICVVYLRGERVNDGSGNVKWTKVADSKVNFTTPERSGKGTHANNSPTTIALADGSLIRRVYGWDYNDFTRLPGTAFMQRSTDAGRTWSSPPTTNDRGKTWSTSGEVQQFLLDPVRFTVQVTRLRRLSDGRLVMLGYVWNGLHTQSAPGGPLMMVSSDEAATWHRIEFTGPGWKSEYNSLFNEWDVAELATGDLLLVTRTHDNKARWCGLMTKVGDRWEVKSLAKSIIPHSGHPELLKTREGPVFHIATTGTLWTNDAGATWHPLRVDSLADLPGGDYRSLYYPISLQTPDGWIYVFSHRGSDNYYGQLDQAIFMDKFRLTLHDMNETN